MRDIKNDFKTNIFKPVYLLYGEETYLVRHYANQFLNLIDDTVMNRATFEGKEFDVKDLINAADTLPFFSDWRLIFVKESGLVTTGRKDATEALSKYLPAMPRTTIMIFVETALDKRNRLYKQIASIGRAVEFPPSTDSDLVRWIINIFKKRGKTIETSTANLLLRTVPKGMDTIYTELDKLDSFTGDRTAITADDIQKISTKSLEFRVFDIIKALCDGKVETALIGYHNLLSLKEQPLMILSMIARQFRIILKCKAVSKKMNVNQIATTFGLRTFMVQEALRQSQRFSEPILIQALCDCQETDIKIKTGLLTQETGVELLIIKYART
ncbi:MAG: DNA polymerase III subunit delta [Turicibacter sp.]|nr:DNA polymerase III subunit delta [Turicibacter sp.]